MRDILVSVTANVIMIAAAYVYASVVGKDNGGGVELWSGVALIVILMASVTTCFFNRMRNKFLAAQKFDFKFFADARVSERALEKLYAMFGKKDFDDVGVSPSFVPLKTVCGEKNRAYISSSEFFRSSNPMLQEFRCRSVRNDQKAGKVFLQLSFIPVDSDGNTILIQRQPSYHPGDFGLKLRHDLSFVSFSPIPPRYNSSDFTVEESYHNEVPYAWGELQGVEPKIAELGAVIRKHRDAVYVFWVFAAHYPKDILFDGKTTDGVSNLEKLFYEDTIKYNDREAFLKDHDKLVAVAKVKDLKAYAKMAITPHLPLNPFGMSFWRTLKLKCLMLRTEIKPAEKCVLENLV